MKYSNFHSSCKNLTVRIHLTRMHSSRMRTAHLLTVSQHALPGGVPARRVCTCLGEVYLPRGVAALGCTCPGGVPARGCTCPGGVPARGVPAWGCTCQRWCTYQGVPAQVLPLWTEWQTGAKILPCPKLGLLAAKISRMKPTILTTPTSSNFQAINNLCLLDRLIDLHTVKYDLL